MKEDEKKMDELLNQLLDKDRYTLNEIVNNFQKDIPQFLYKYRSFYNEDGSENEYWKDYLLGKFHLNVANNFEDVNDCKPFFDRDKLINIMIDELIDKTSNNQLKKRFISEYIIKNDENIMNEIHKYIKEVEENYKKIHIGCFTNTNKNDEMWKKYADNYQGFCIEYNIEEHERLKDSILHVCYVKEKDRKKYVDKTDIVKRLIKHEPLSLIDQKDIFNLLFIKTDDWSFEKEYRLFLLEHRTMNDKSMLKRKDVLDSNNNINLASAIRAIYLGKDFEQNNNYKEIKEQVMEIASKRNISVYKINKNNECITILNNKE